MSALAFVEALGGTDVQTAQALVELLGVHGVGFDRVAADRARAG